MLTYGDDNISSLDEGKTRGSSTCGIIIAHVEELNTRIQVTALNYASLSLRHAHSCPDLSGIHLMHPKLHGTVMTSTTDAITNLMRKKYILSSSLSPKEEVPVGLHKCKRFILDYWTDTVPSTISEDL